MPTNYHFKKDNFATAYALTERMHAHNTQELLETYPNVDYDTYVKAEQSGTLLTFVVYDDDVAVGYCLMLVSRDLHNMDRILAYQDALYIDPQHRNGVGARFIAWMDKQIDADVIMRTTRLDSADSGTIYTRLGYETKEVIYEKHRR